MTDDKFGPIDLNNWNKIPFLKGRVANDEDIKFGRAIFMVEGDEHEPIHIEIPALAFQTDEETGERRKVVMIQAERVGTDEVVGIRYIDGGDGVCMRFELDFISD
jgi:hypothetical protein